MRYRWLLLFCLWGNLYADDAQLTALRSTLVALRKDPSDSAGPRGASPQLTIAKHQLRDWVEGRLAAFAQRDDVGDFQRKLNSELREAKLFCGEDQSPPCPD